MASNNLIVKDEEYYTAAYKVRKLGEYLSNANDYYYKILSYIIDEAVMDDLIKHKLKSMLAQVKPLSKSMQEFSNVLPDHLERYIIEIDESDSFLY